jgi:ankyrin repeat protein
LGAKASMTVVASTVGTPLHLAAIMGHKEIVSVLLDAGCPFDEVNIEGRSALHYAAGGGVVEIIGILIDRGLGNSTTSSCFEGFWIESRFGCQSKKDKDGLTPLHLASACGKLEAVRELLRLGANASMTVVAGEASMTVVADLYGTPLHRAATMGHKEYMELHYIKLL